tara:strand:- start:3110 stop:3295 length:186 start_codon:yes stop_codon:yes gene_type:complete
VNSLADEIRNFCSIQLQILKDKEERLRREILDCKIQAEYLTTVLASLENEQKDIIDIGKKN